MQKKRYLAALAVILVLASLMISGCKKAECKTAEDCVGKSRQAFTAQCVDGNCVYNPLPNICGNERCEPAVNENKCSCPADCGQCSGKVTGSNYLTQDCVNNVCVESVPAAKVKPVYVSAELTSAGDRFKLDTVYSQPFNMKKDLFKIKLTLTSASDKVDDRKITGIVLEARTADRRTITIGEKTVNKFLWAAGFSIDEEVIVNFPTAELEGELSSLTVKVDYDYATVYAGGKTPKSATMKKTYTEKFIFVNPKAQYPCPESCDDNNPGTTDYCGPETDYFCMHSPKPGLCGNFICDANENKCTCPRDCGPCTGSAGAYLDYTCKDNRCITVMKPGITVTPQAIFDDRNLGMMHLNNYYNYNTPFNINTDSFKLEFGLYELSEGITNPKIETIRVLDGTQVLASQTVNQVIPEGAPLSVEVSVQNIAQPEEEHSVTLGIWYAYTKAGSEEKGNYNKALGKIVFINPG